MREGFLFLTHVCGGGSSLQLEGSGLQCYGALPACTTQDRAGMWGGRNLWRPLVQGLLQAGLSPQLDQVAQIFVQASFRDLHGQRSHRFPGHELHHAREGRNFSFCPVTVSLAVIYAYCFLFFCCAPLRRVCLQLPCNPLLVCYLTKCYR